MKVGNETLSYMIYMANRWSKGEAIYVFGNNLGEHIWNKYLGYTELYGMHAAYAKLVFELDSECISKLVGRAVELYDGRKNR